MNIETLNKTSKDMWFWRETELMTKKKNKSMSVGCYEKERIVTKEMKSVKNKIQACKMDI